MTSYYVHLGFDWNSYKIGTAWGTDPGGDNPNRYLQFALTTNKTIGTNPQWSGALFRFQPNDTLSFLLWDISLPVQNKNNGPSCQGYLGINDLTATNFWDPGNPTSIYQSNSGLWCSKDLIGNATAGTFNTKKCILLFNKTQPTTWSDKDLSPWGRGYCCVSATDPLVLGDPWPGKQYPFLGFKMSFFVRVTYGSETRTFVVDPEVITGSGVQR